MKMATALSVSELFKYSWRLDKFISKYENKESFALMTNSKAVLAFDKETLATLKKKKSDQYRTLTFRDAKVKSRTYKLSNFMKNEEFGGKPVGKGAAGIDAEHRAAQNINDQINALLSKSGKKSIKLKIASNTYDVAKTVKVEGNVKSDLAMLDTEGNEVVWISYKMGTRSKDFQQWGGMTETIIQNHPEVQKFIAQLQKKFKDVMPNATTVGKMIKDSMLKKYSVYGSDFKVANRNLGRQNVSIVLQGDITVRKDGIGYGLTAAHAMDNGDVITGDYEPVLMAIYKGDRSQFGLKGARFVIQPKASRSVTEWIET